MKADLSKFSTKIKKTKDSLNVWGEKKDDNPIRQQMDEETGKMKVFLGHGGTLAEASADSESKYLSKIENKFEAVATLEERCESPEIYEMIQKYQLPRVVTPEKLRMMLKGWEMGLDDTEVARLAEVSVSTVYRSYTENPTLKELRDVYRAQPRVVAKQNVYKRLNNDPTGEYSLRYLERVKPEEFGGKGAVINITNDNRSVTVEDKMAKITELLESIG